MHVNTPRHFIDAFFASLGFSCDSNALIGHILEEQEFQFTVYGKRTDTQELLNWLENRPLEKDSAIRAHAMLDAALTEKTVEVSDLNTALRLKAGEVANMTSLLNDSSALLEAEKNRCLVFAHETNQLSGRLHETEEILHRSSAELKSTKEQFESVMNSTSWKLTRPLRSLIGFLR
jgi:hypothetical protein